ncbi:hypothetical protein [Pseudomonas sp. W2-17]|uniref:hypothetical protein n=1 Tax=Pseudomonas sp. W2-17 TaxID=3058039 RepID=UPI0034E077F3
MSNLLKNGDFASGELEPWTTTSSEESWEIKQDASGHYMQLAKAGNLSKATLEGSFKPTALTFEVRAGEVVKPGDFVVFSHAALVTTADGAELFADISGATKDWQRITLKIDRKPIPASTVTVQVHTASDPEKLRAQAGQVHFRNFQLT